MQRFGSVTVLNGHIHQVQQKVEGNITFHTAMSTAFPQPAPGPRQRPARLVVPAHQLRQVIGVRTVTYVAGPAAAGPRRLPAGLTTARRRVGEEERDSRLMSTATTAATSRVPGSGRRVSSSAGYSRQPTARASAPGAAAGVALPALPRARVARGDHPGRRATGPGHGHTTAGTAAQA